MWYRKVDFQKLLILNVRAGSKDWLSIHFWYVGTNESSRAKIRTERLPKGLGKSSRYCLVPELGRPSWEPRTFAPELFKFLQTFISGKPSPTLGFLVQMNLWELLETGKTERQFHGSNGSCPKTNPPWFIGRGLNSSCRGPQPLNGGCSCSADDA